jgi:hypothetical protein
VGRSLYERRNPSRTTFKVLAATTRCEEPKKFLHSMHLKPKVSRKNRIGMYIIKTTCKCLNKIYLPGSTRNIF